MNAIWARSVFANVVVVVVVATPDAARAEARNMIGRQSQNEGILVLPTPGKVVVDGDLSDWDLSGRI